MRELLPSYRSPRLWSVCVCLCLSVCLYVYVSFCLCVCQPAHVLSDGSAVRHRSMELSRSAVGTPPDFTPGFIKSSPSGSRRPQRLDRSSSSMKKGETSAGVAGRHKVIQVSLQQDVKLHTADNAWKPVLSKKELTDDDEQLVTEVR